MVSTSMAAFAALSPSRTSSNKSSAIDDEHDTEDAQAIRKEAPREFTVRALTPIADFNEYFSTRFSDEEYDTIGGLLMQEFGRLPRRGETIKIDGYEFVSCVPIGAASIC